MKNIQAKYLANILAVATAALLVACGGGGSSTAPVSYIATCTGGSTVTSTISQADAAAKCPNVGSATLVLSVPISTYPAVSEEKAAFDLLNAERSRCGFGLLAQNTQLDAAAKGHADYQIVNNILSHFEDLQKYPLGFTGATAYDRAVSAKYTSAALVGDEISNTNVDIQFGVGGVRGLLSAPYHLSGLMQGWKDIGISVRRSTDVSATASPRTVLQINTGLKNTDNRQQLAAASVVTYPCKGSTGVNRQLLSESPNPVPGRDLSTNPIGASIYIAVRYGSTLGISTVSMRETVTNMSVVLRTPVLAANDPNGLLASHEGYVAPDGPLKPFTNYTVFVTGTNNGSAFSDPVLFDFTTGN